MQKKPEPKQQVQKGWLSRWTRKQWSRHWFVLKGGSLTYYRGPAAELCSFLDGVLDLSLIKHIEVQPAKSVVAAGTTGHAAPSAAAAANGHQGVLVSAPAANNNQQQKQQPFTFSLKMWSGECHLLAAASLAERSGWLEAINACTNGCLLDDEASTDSASSTDSSPTSNLSTRSCDIGLSAVRYRNAILSQQQLQQQNDQIAIDKIAMSLRTAIKRREQQLRLDLSSIRNNSSSNNNNNSSNNNNNLHSSTNSETNNLRHNNNKHASSQQATTKSSPIEPPPHSASQLRDTTMKESKCDDKGDVAEVGAHHGDDDREGDDDDDQSNNDDGDDVNKVVDGGQEEEEEEEEGEENEDRDDDDEENGDDKREDEHEADESESDETGEQEEPAKQAFKRRLMCVPQQVGCSALKALAHSEPKLISRVAASDSSDDEIDLATQQERSEQQQPSSKKQTTRKRVTFDLSQSSQRLLTSSSSSGSGSGSDSDSASSGQSYEESSEESSLSSVEEPDEKVEGNDELATIGEPLEAATRTDSSHERLSAAPPEGAGGGFVSDLSGAICPMDTSTGHDHDWLAIPSAGQAAAAAVTVAQKDHEEAEEMGANSGIHREQAAAAAKIEELELKHERAQASIGLLELRLSNSCASYAQLELAYSRLQSDLAKRDELNRIEASQLQARIEELQHQLASSELKLLEARDRLLEFEQAQQQQLERQHREQQQQHHHKQRISADVEPIKAASGLQQQQQPPSSLVGNPAATKAAASWLRQINQQQQKPLFLMHHVRHTLAANQQTIGLKLLNQSKQIQRKLNELELKVDKINQPGQ